MLTVGFEDLAELDVSRPALWRDKMNVVSAFDWCFLYSDARADLYQCLSFQYCGLLVPGYPDNFFQSTLGRGSNRRRGPALSELRE